MRYYLIAGEASGDLHASNLIREIKKLDPQASFRGFGGELMENEGMAVVKHYREMAFMGFVPVLMNLKTIRRNLKQCEEDLASYKPNVLILIDYPGFNLRMAAYAKSVGIRVFYYISPKIWAWKTYRIKKIKAFVDEMFTIFPFETDFYAEHGYPVTFVGNPILDATTAQKSQRTFEQFTSDNQLDGRPIIALLPGSRLQEISSLLPKMVGAATAFPGFQIVVTAAPNIDDSVYNKLLQSSKIKLVRNQTYDVLSHARAAVLASGTVSLEAAILQCPQVVCYRMAGGALFFLIAKIGLKIKWVSLVNLILQREAVRELLQHYCTTANIKKELEELLHNENRRYEIAKSYQELGQKLGEAGASRRAAQAMLEKLFL